MFDTLDPEFLIDQLPLTKDYQNFSGFSYMDIDDCARHVVFQRNLPSRFEASGDVNNAPTDNKNLNSIMSIFSNMYSLRRPPEIRAFLEENDFLNPLISEAYTKLQRHFPNSPIFVEVDQDELVIAVGTSLSPKEVDERLHNFDEEWWIDASEKSKARLCITVEFQ